ncbi:DUF2207 family protein [Mycobacterium talmoniae]|uniref:DUF2207 domain-containing protein n=1 Tax=Mycobacterium talmoniae TaxID=1858794 RepID=A0A1S1N989_9MYCO|nr:DUF2207 domain-containing protein [Mycobacterium talmoniae]OHU96080.1 hypothetical protein BKN37_22790 [Mycobacterium talmoniae]
MKLDVQMNLKADGSLAVTATIAVPQGGSASDRLPLDIPVEANRVQHFQVSDLTTTGGASAQVDGRNLVISVPTGTSTVTYTVAGTVSDSPDLQQFTWLLAAGWSSPIETLTGTFVSPAAAPDSPICAYGLLGERRLCSLTQTEVAGKVTFQQNGLKSGSVAVFSVLLPSGTVTATAEFSPLAGAGAAPAHDLGGVIAVAVATMLALLLAGFGWLRRRADDAVAHTAGATAQLLVPGDGGLAFASPDGVLPGQVGTLTTGRARPADIGATILDLAVRNYLWIAELPGQGGALDYQISRRAPLDGAVTDFERAVVDAVLPGGRENVAASELTHRPVDLVASRSKVAASVADSGWLRRNARRLEWAGFALLGIGAVAAACLAVLGAGVLWGVAVAVLGGGVAAAGRLLPPRTKNGTRLAAAISGMRQYLTEVNLAEVEEAARPVLFQRAIPYAHALGELRGWLARWGPSQPARAEWYRPAGDRSVLAGLPTLAAVLDGVAAQSEAIEER